MRVDFHISALWAWIHFVAFTVLPIAFQELLRWVYEWQILLTGVLALVAARIWGKSVIRAARIAAKAEQPAPAEIQKKPTAVPKVVPVPLGASIGAGRSLLEPQAGKPQARSSELADRLFALREQIRVTLGKTPCTDDVLNAERLADCRRIAEFPLGEPPADAPKLLAHRFDVLRSELSALGAVRETDTCRNAWEALARISIDARDMLGPEAASAAAATK
jgi:hypothetical protein